MKTVIVYDKTGNVFFSMQNNDLQDKYNCIITDIEEGKEIVSVDVCTGQVITKDKETRTEDIKNYLDSADGTTISKIEDTILEVETEKALSEV